MQLPKVNQKVELIVLDGSYAGPHSTYVEEVNQRQLTVARPFVGVTPVPFAIGETVRIEYLHEIYAYLGFSAKVESLHLSGVPMVALTAPALGQIDRVQRREYVRLDVNVNLTYSVIPPVEEEGEPGPRLRSRSRDIGGGGAQVWCDREYPNGTLLDLELEIAGLMVKTTACVVRSVEQAGPGGFWLGIQFTNLQERDRDKIFRFIFNVQRDRRQKGWM